MIQHSTPPSASDQTPPAFSALAVNPGNSDCLKPRSPSLEHRRTSRGRADHFRNHHVARPKTARLFGIHPDELLPHPCTQIPTSGSSFEIHFFGFYIVTVKVDPQRRCSAPVGLTLCVRIDHFATNRMGPEKTDGYRCFFGTSRYIKSCCTGP